MARSSKSKPEVLENPVEAQESKSDASPMLVDAVALMLRGHVGPLRASQVVASPGTRLMVLLKFLRDTEDLSLTNLGKQYKESLLEVLPPAVRLALLHVDGLEQLKKPLMLLAQGGNPHFQLLCDAMDAEQALWINLARSWDANVPSREKSLIWHNTAQNQRVNKINTGRCAELAHTFKNFNQKLLLSVFGFKKPFQDARELLVKISKFEKSSRRAGAIEEEKQLSELQKYRVQVEEAQKIDGAEERAKRLQELNNPPSAKESVTKAKKSVKEFSTPTWPRAHGPIQCFPRFSLLLTASHGRLLAKASVDLATNFRFLDVTSGILTVSGRRIQP